MKVGSILLLLASARVMAEPHALSADFSAPGAPLRALHGIGRGPLSANGLINVTDYHRQLRVPSNRLHDCQHPNPRVVDIHAIFPNPDADPALPESYQFAATDEFLATVAGTGAQIIYRLGESIEHQSVKQHVHPPRDPRRWAEVCAGIVRHYNEGWAAGHRMGIRYWEIWNEPENRPVMWTGNDAQFLELYKVTALRLRQEFPALKIGGPAFGYYGKFDGTKLEPSEFCLAFLEQCRGGAVPLDFFSWHCYTNNPDELAARAKAVRRLLDERGFSKTESHLNEWNYLPDNQWDILGKEVKPEARQRAADRMAGPEAGAFIAGSLIALQEAPVDVCNFYHAEGGIFGLFTEVGAPTRNYFSMLAFSELLLTPRRAATTGGLPQKLWIAAGLSADNATASVLIANLSGPEELTLTCSGFPAASATVLVADETRKLEPLPRAALENGGLTLRLKPPFTALVKFTRRQ